MPQTIKIENKEIGLKAVINLTQGARLKTLVLNDIPLITEDKNTPYNESFAAAILFPFANRIQEGRYEFKGKTYQLNCNESGGNNAIHGLVYDKKFIVKKIKTTKKSLSISLVYKEKKEIEGYPFKYNIKATYVFRRTTTTLHIDIKNKSLESMPFTLGWHPYFNSSDLPASNLQFKSSEKISFDKNLITKEVLKKETKMPLQIKNNEYDDCFLIEDSKFAFITPAYNLTLHSEPMNEYLQIYNQKNSNKIALELMSGVSNSFNNKIGLQELKPNEVYSTSYVLNINSNNQNH